MAGKARNIYQKILSERLLEGSLVPGEEIGIRIDQTLTQDATGTLASLQLEALHVARVSPELSISYVDHNTTQQGFENADDHKYLETVASRYGILFSKPGNGICHQVHLERFASPGKTLLGSDSHTPTAGALGCLAIGAGGLDVALAMAGKPFYCTVPRVIRIELTGHLKPYVSAKDIILHILRVMTTNGNVGFAIEYAGDALEGLTVPMRGTVANMGAETGVTTSIFPSDERAREFLKRQSREKDWIELAADKGAEYERTIRVNLDELEPLAARPHSPDNIDLVEKVKGTRIDQVCIGSCTNSSYEDLMMTAAILRGKKVHPAVSLIVAPGSRQVLDMISENGALSELIKSGARIAESACGFCIGATHAPPSRGVSLRTSNRNFRGRSGTADAEVYLVSPIVAALSALHGAITSPAGLQMPLIAPPESYPIDDSMVLKPRYEGEPIRGPNIREMPRLEELPREIHGIVSIKVGDKVTTDHIMPAGSRLKFRSNIETYAGFVFEGLDTSFVKRARENREKELANIIIAGKSYGQGSSREHAALCPASLGVKVVVAKSIERIHRQNLINFGIVPLLFEHEDDYDRIEENDPLEIPEFRSQLARQSYMVAVNETKGARFRLIHDLRESEVRVLLKGGKLNYYAE
jgi:aconitate hydratase